MGSTLRSVGRAIDPTRDPLNLILPVAIANGATAATGSRAGGAIAAGPYAAAAGGTSSGRMSPLPGGGDSGPPVYQPRYDPSARMPEYSRQPGDISGYAMNPHQKALADALRSRPPRPTSSGQPYIPDAQTQVGPGIQTPPPAAASPTAAPAPVRGGGWSGTLARILRAR